MEILRFKKIIWFINFCLTVGILLFVNFFAAFADQKYKVYFHNPESNINNYALLKKEFDKYLSDYGNFEFQPFSNRDTFEKHIIAGADVILVVSSWYYKILSEKFSIKAALIGVLNGKTTHRKVLCVNEKVTGPDLLENNTVASSGSEDYTRKILIQMLGEEERKNVYSLKILTVPKDIDALMAVGFGIADLALTTENSLIKLKKINPKQYNMLRQLAISDEILLPIIAVREQSNVEIEMLVKIIEDMGTSPDGKKNLKMLGLDGWKRLNMSEREFLEK